MITDAITGRILNLIVLPTEACNFRCVYCYESFKVGKMREPVIQGIKKLIDARIDGLDTLAVSWFGGEPLLAPDVIKDISEHILTQVARHSEVVYESSISTNGYFLKPDVFRKLLGWNVRTYQISFDGPKELHNDKRVLANGGQTFDEIWANLVDMRYVDEEFAAIVRIHVDRLNSCRIPDLLAELAQSFAGDSRFKIFLRTLSCLGGPNDSDLQVLGKEESAASLGELRNLARSQSLEVVQPNNDNHVCYAAKLNSFVIRATGSIGKCTIALDNELNDIGQLNSDGTMSFRKERLFRWVRGLESGDRAELFCPLDNIGTIDSIVTIS